MGADVLQLKSGYYCKLVLAESLVFQNPPLRQAWERWAQWWKRG
jgi:hypothetical protein